MKEEVVQYALLAMQRHSWEQGVSMQAFLERNEMHILIPMAYEAINRSMPDGRVATIGVSNGITDPCSAGEGLLKAYKVTGDEKLKTAHEALLNWAIKVAPRNKEGILYHITDSKEFWADSMYMLPPFLADAGYINESIKQIEGYWRALYNPEKSLMHHMWDDKNKKFTRKDFWGVGNGWNLAGIAGVIEKLPDTHIEKENLINKVNILLQGVLKYQNADGTFHDILDNPATFKEVNLSQMVAYTLYKGMKQGWINKKYKTTADHLRHAAESRVDNYGYVQQVCGAPTFDKPGIAPEAQAFYLLMQHAFKEYSKCEHNI